MAVFDVVLDEVTHKDGASASAGQKPGAGAGGAGGGAAASPEVERALQKAGWRLIPLTMAVAISNHMDRSNLAYAALSFNRDNGFNGRAYSIGTACFYASFMVMMLPSNLVMVRVGTRYWLGFLLVAWGAVAACFSLVSSAGTFYLLRALLGAFEAGAFPAMWHSLSTFYPRNRITKPFAYLTIAVMVANMIGAPIAAGLLAMDGVAGLKGWQWLFIVEGIPSAVLGALVLLLLPSSVAAAKFLTPKEKAALEAEFARDSAPGPLGAGLQSTAALLRMVAGNFRLWVAFVAGALSSVSSHTYLTYVPILINSLLSGKALTNEVSVAAEKGRSSLLPVALAVVPYTLASLASYAVAASAQRRNEHFFHVSGCLLLSGTIMALFPVMAGSGAAGGFVSLTLSLALGAAANGPATALVARLCKGPEQVVAMPIFSSFAVLGGIAGPLMAGAILNTMGGFKYLTIIMGVLLVLTGALVFGLRFLVHATGGVPADAAARAAPSTEAAELDGLPESPARSLASSEPVPSVTVVLGRDSEGGAKSPTAGRALR